MSEPIPESIPTSVSNRSYRPAKKLALTPSSKQSAQVDALFANPEQADRLIAVGPKLKSVQAPPEIVANVQGSSAGAGSGEFHVYKASRRREYDRLRAMEEENKFEEAEKEHQTRREEWERKDQEKLSKNRAKREKARARQQKRKLGNSDTMEANEEANDNTPVTESVKKKLGPAKALPHARENTTQDLPRDSSQGHDEAGVEEAGLTIHDDD